MTEQLTSYLIGIIPSFALVIGAIPVIIRTFCLVRKVTKRDSYLSDDVKVLVKKLDEVLDDNAKLRKENIQLRRQNNRIMSKITHVYIEDKEE